MTNWRQVKLGEVLKVGSGKDYKHLEVGDVPVFGTGGFMLSVNDYLGDGETVFVGRKGTIDKPFYFKGKFWTVDTLFYTYGFKDVNVKFISYKFQLINWYKYNEASGVPSLSKTTIEKIPLLLPPLSEQEKIVEVLTTWDEYLEKLDGLIAAKRELKKGLMQELLTGKRRLPGFVGEWKEVKLGEVAKCLDNKRVPLNSEQRSKIKGDIPYLGANGIVDYIDNYIFDEDIILIAEDGGNFNDFQTRPVAYRFYGKSWVNNHAHVVKAKKGVSQDLLYYLSVHKNLLPYLSGGTRQKLNKSDLMKIRFSIPRSFEEQTAIAEILSTADAQIDALVSKREAIADQRKYLLENLVTGKIRVM